MKDVNKPLGKIMRWEGGGAGVCDGVEGEKRFYNRFQVKISSEDKE